MDDAGDLKYMAEPHDKRNGTCGSYSDADTIRYSSHTAQSYDVSAFAEDQLCIN